MSAARAAARKDPEENHAVSEDKKHDHVPFPMEDDGAPAPPDQTGSYSMVAPRFRDVYFQFYKETYKPSVLDRKTKELVAIAGQPDRPLPGLPAGPHQEGAEVRRHARGAGGDDRHRAGRQRGRGRRPHRHRGREPRPEAVLSEQSLQERYAPGTPASAAGQRTRRASTSAASWKAMPSSSPSGRRAPSRGVPGHPERRHHRRAARLPQQLDGRASPDGARPAPTTPPCTVTADYAVKLLRPTPMPAPCRLRARVVESTDDRAVVEATLEAGGKVCATCRGTFVAVKPGHPAYHRW